MLSRGPIECRRLADLLAGKLGGRGVSARVVDSHGQCGGGTLPDLVIPSAAVALDIKAGRRADEGRRVLEALLRREIPVVGVLREGVLCFDMLTVQEGDIPAIVDAVAEACGPEGR
jgi:L-seryl-tRNA(Ser) seleniumtransferase